MNSPLLRIWTLSFIVWMAWCCLLQDGKPFIRLWFRTEKALLKRFWSLRQHPFIFSKVERHPNRPDGVADESRGGRVSASVLLRRARPGPAEKEPPLLAAWVEEDFCPQVELPPENVISGVCHRRKSVRAAFGALPFLLPISRLASLASHSPQSDHAGLSYDNHLTLCFKTKEGWFCGKNSWENLREKISSKSPVLGDAKLTYLQRDCQEWNLFPGPSGGINLFLWEVGQRFVSACLMWISQDDWVSEPRQVSGGSWISCCASQTSIEAEDVAGNRQVPHLC